MILRLDGPDAEQALAELLSAAEYDRLAVTIERAADYASQHLYAYTLTGQRQVVEFEPLYDGEAAGAERAHAINETYRNGDQP